MNLGYILRSGELWTDLAAWRVPKDLARQYVEEVATAFECEVRPANEGWSVYRNGKALRIGDVLDRLQAWLPAMQNFISSSARHDSARVHAGAGRAEQSLTLVIALAGTTAYYAQTGTADIPRAPIALARSVAQLPRLNATQILARTETTPDHKTLGSPS